MYKRRRTTYMLNTNLLFSRFTCDCECTLIILYLAMKSMQIKNT